MHQLKVAAVALPLALLACRTDRAARFDAALPTDLIRELDRLGATCRETRGLECLARKGDVCDAMWRIAHACYEATVSAGCAALEEQTERAMRSVLPSPSEQLHVARLCASACEARAAHHPWDDVAQALDVPSCR